MLIPDTACERHIKEVGETRNVILSMDGVQECNSSSRSLQILSMQFEDCFEVYPCIISRPETFQKKSMRENFDAYVANFISEINDSSLHLKKVVMDAPERAACRQQKQHGGYYSCDLCTANPDNVQIPGKRGSESYLIAVSIHGTDLF